MPNLQTIWTAEKTLSRPPDLDSKYTKNQVFILHDPLDSIPLSKTKIEDIFLPAMEKITLEFFQKYQILDPVSIQPKCWHKYKTKPVKADITILRNRTLLRHFRKPSNTTITETTIFWNTKHPEQNYPLFL